MHSLYEQFVSYELRCVDVIFIKRESCVRYWMSLSAATRFRPLCLTGRVWYINYKHTSFLFSYGNFQPPFLFQTVWISNIYYLPTQNSTLQAKLFYFACSVNSSILYKGGYDVHIAQGARHRRFGLFYFAYLFLLYTVKELTIIPIGVEKNFIQKFHK